MCADTPLEDIASVLYDVFDFIEVTLSLRPTFLLSCCASQNVPIVQNFRCLVAALMGGAASVSKIKVYLCSAM